MSLQDDVDIEEMEEIIRDGEDAIEEEEAGEKSANAEDVNDDLDETLGERLWGLTEMFPSWLRSGVSSFSSGSICGAKSIYSMSRTALWIVFSSSVILVAPVIFEVERAQMDEMQKQQQRQILLGPNAAMTGQPHFPVPMPPNPVSQSR